MWYWSLTIHKHEEHTPRKIKPKSTTINTIFSCSPSLFPLTYSSTTIYLSSLCSLSLSLSRSDFGDKEDDQPPQWKSRSTTTENINSFKPRSTPLFLRGIHAEGLDHCEAFVLTLWVSFFLWFWLWAHLILLLFLILFFISLPFLLWFLFSVDLIWC